jgi:ribosomal protein S18 acetylase RimI-like enzyme
MLASRTAQPILTAAGPEDSDFRFHLYLSTRFEEVSIFGWDEPQQATFMRMQFRARDQSYANAYPAKTVSLVLFDGQRVGAVIVDRSEHEIRLIDIALLPEARGHGIGTALIQALMDESRNAGKPLRLQVAKGNRAAALYSRLGFVKTGEDDVYESMEIR